MHARQQDARGEVWRQQTEREQLRGGRVGAERAALRRERVERGQAHEGEAEERQQREGLREEHRVGHLLEGGGKQLALRRERGDGIGLYLVRDGLGRLLGEGGGGLLGL